jgi:hypothetical protein
MVSAIACFVAGCGQKQAPISGRVLIDGKPLPAGRVTFRPDNPSQNSVSAELDEHGQWNTMLPLGKVHVSVDNREWAPRPARGEIALPTLPPELRSKIAAAPRGDPAPPKPSPRYIKIPERYAIGETDELDFTVEAGMTSHDIQLKSS